MKKKLVILGTRGVPAEHSGFEYFAAALSVYLVEKGWNVTVACQEDDSEQWTESEWHGVHRVHVPAKYNGSLGSIVFDLRSILWVCRQPEKPLVLTLGYNTAVFSALLRFKRIYNIINMDGIEWKRGKWSRAVKLWFFFNELVGCWFGNHLVADNPGISEHLAKRVSRRKITMIPYGADRVDDADEKLLSKYGISVGHYALIIARPEPENTILEIVEAFVKLDTKQKLVVLGNYDNPKNTYQQKVRKAASENVVFPGAIFEPDIVQALRRYTTLYIHGHTVGGTNPSLVEALGCGSPVLAHDNQFNRWVAGEGALYFDNPENCAKQIHDVFSSPSLRKSLSEESYKRQKEAFEWRAILISYETMLLEHSETKSQGNTKR